MADRWDEGDTADCIYRATWVKRSWGIPVGLLTLNKKVSISRCCKHGKRPQSEYGFQSLMYFCECSGDMLDHLHDPIIIGVQLKPSIPFPLKPLFVPDTPLSQSCPHTGVSVMGVESNVIVAVAKSD